ncbi:MAG: metal-dependent transcriptional regulator [Candidatus Thermoplasmatota archaeon]|nr:metal-dependent transcriptional regulator [Candidatus Thermoplasmatota archaeon]
MRKKTIEDYVEMVHDLQQEKKPVHTNDIAAALQINPASVSEILQKLSEEGYIKYQKYGGATLTSKGKKVAIATKKRHDTLTEFLMLLGIDKNIAEKDACEMEHILHADTMETIIKFVEVIKHCEATPFWLKRLKEYVKTGKLAKCPSKMIEVCLQHARKIK